MKSEELEEIRQRVISENDIYLERLIGDPMVDDEGKVVVPGYAQVNNEHAYYTYLKDFYIYYPNRDTIKRVFSLRDEEDTSLSESDFPHSIP